MKEPKQKESEIILDEFLRVKKEKLQFPNGYEHSHYTLSLPAPTSVSVIAVDEKRRLIINEEYRRAAGGVVLSLPGGFLHAGETPVQGARRELLEETGYDSENLKEIGRAFPMPGICDQQVIYVMASGCKKTHKPDLEGGEMIRTVLMPESNLQQSIKQGKPVDGILLAGLWFYLKPRNELVKGKGQG